MASIKHKIRTNQALQVLRRSTDGSSIVEACQDVGIARSTYYYFVATHPDAIASYQEMEMVSNLEQLSIILGNKLQMLEHVIKDALSDKTTPRHRLAILKYITDRSDELIEKLELVSQSEPKDVDDILSGPKLVQGISRFSSSENAASGR